MANLIGQTIGQYQIVERLGRGGMADVYKVFHPGLAVYRAMKVVRPEFVTEAGFKARFQREARAVAALRHSNIVQMHDFGIQQNLYYMVMEFIAGQDLKTHLTERGQMRPFSEVVAIIEQVASALSYAHQRGVVHRDIKPANIMLTAEGQAILTDFGIARIVAGEERMTQTGAGIGTPAYMAPEQAQGLPDIGPQADVYSLGIVLYEMLTGRVPYSADTPLAVMFKVINDPLPPPRDFSPDIPDVLQGVILKATTKEPAQRYQTAEALIDGLKRSLDAKPDMGQAVSRPSLSEPVAHPTVTAKPEPRRPKTFWWVAGAVLAILCLLLSGAGAGLYFWTRPIPSLATWQFVIDASAGMGETIDGRPKMEIARAALAEELDILPSNVKAGLRVFGGNSSGLAPCEDTALLVEPASGQSEQLTSALSKIIPTGQAPLTAAIVQAIGDFDLGPDTNNTLIIITAGLDTCEQDAVAQLETLSRRLGIEFELQLIGLGVADATTQDQLRQLAEVVGGEYHDAQSQADIRHVFEREVARLVGKLEPTLTPGQANAPAARTGEETDLQFGETVSGAVAVAEADSYTFEATSGDQILVKVVETSSSGLSPEVRIYQADGSEICSEYIYDTHLEVGCQLESDGQHTVLVSSLASSGEYSLYLQRTNNPVDATVIEFGETVSGAVAVAEADSYTFEASAGDQLLVKVVETSSSGLTPEVRIYQADGSQICSEYIYDTHLEVECQLESDGQHTLLVSSLNSSGEYSLSLNRLN